MKNFIEDSKFFFTSYHTGTVNIILHIISAIIFVLGLLNKNIVLAILGLAVIDELGHIYNYYILHKHDYKFSIYRMMPYQLIYVIPPALVIFKVFGLI